MLDTDGLVYILWVWLSNSCPTKHIPLSCRCKYQVKTSLIKCDEKDNLLNEQLPLELFQVWEGLVLKQH